VVILGVQLQVHDGTGRIMKYQIIIFVLEKPDLIVL